ncbi:TPA: LysR substrate-binding domain-containing protein [Clostridioides difficile]|nr:LysR family transcriptional regulator [Clostridioides difficile]VIG31656.1 LysR family transcriptional regulator [Clostridioides difficile]VII05686.1 LysR family transcriptional regulator [Clostridioides difficile]HAU5238216.1 LysR family transcriptional regulator [Clostridioides difficile]HAU5255749.1 LysR family transcriptional regulator [Clostridioides difficile]
MDIKQLKYFVEIVKSGFNLSIASKTLHISQPALSQIIKNFEESEDVYLFERYKGRLNGLTPAGERFYVNAEHIINEYKNMMEDLREDSVQFKGKIRIGIPPLILGIVFSDVVAQLVANNPDIEFDIVERGAYDLSRMIILQELDYAVLLHPHKIDKSVVTEHVLQEDELTAFLNINHPLAKKDKIDWNDLNEQLLAIFNPTFMIHHKLMQKFTDENVKLKRYIMSGSWDFLLLSTTNSDFITILPSPVHDFFENSKIIEKPFNYPITWKVVLCRPKKERYSHVDQHVFKFIIDFFSKKNS